MTRRKRRHTLTSDQARAIAARRWELASVEDYLAAGRRIVANRGPGRYDSDLQRRRALAGWETRRRLLGDGQSASDPGM